MGKTMKPSCFGSVRYNPKTDFTSPNHQLLDGSNTTLCFLAHSICFSDFFSAFRSLRPETRMLVAQRAADNVAQLRWLQNLYLARMAIFATPRVKTSSGAGLAMRRPQRTCLHSKILRYCSLRMETFAGFLRWYVCRDVGLLQEFW